MEQITEILLYGQYDNMFVVCQHVCFMFFFLSLSLGNFSLILIVFDKYTYFVLNCLWPVAISNRNERGVYYLHTLALRVSHTIKMRQFQFQFNQLLFFICASASFSVYFAFIFTCVSFFRLVARRHLQMEMETNFNMPRVVVVAVISKA